MIGSIKEIFIQGTRSVFYNWKYIILFWVTNASIAFVLSTPIYYILNANLSHSLMSDKLALGFDYTWYVQLRSLYGNTLDEIPYMMYIAVVSFILLQTFYSAGLITVFHSPKKNHMVDFFYGGVKYWFRFTKVVLISIILYGLAFWINGLLGDLIIYIFRDTEYEMSEFVIRSVRYILLIFFIVVISLIADYTKVGFVVKDREKVFQGIKKALLFVHGNFAVVFSVFITITVVFVSGVMLYNFAGSLIPRTPYYFLVLSFFMQQMLIIFRLLIRMMFYATEVNIYKDINAELIITTTEE